MFKTISRSPIFGRTVQYGFCTNFSKQFGLGYLRTSIRKRMYRRFLKNLNQKYLIPFKLFGAGLFSIGLLIILPGVDFPFQKKLKQGILNAVDELVYYYYKMNPSSQNTTNYLNSLVSTFQYWDKNGLNTTEKTNQILTKIISTLNTLPVSDEVFTNLFSYLDLRIKKIVLMNKQTLKDQTFYKKLYCIFQKYVNFRQNNQSTQIGQVFFQARKDSLGVIFEYLLTYAEQNKQQNILNILTQFVEKQQTFSPILISSKSILKELVTGLNDQRRPQVIKIFEIVSCSEQGKKQMIRTNLIQNLKKYLPKEQITNIIKNFN